MAQTTVPAADGSNIELILRPSQERGNADHGWLKTFHTFNFADYYDPLFEKWGSLRVINEDRVEANQGFGTHAHREFEIFSYIVQGELQHRDSMGNVEVMKRGDVQLTSAGTGIRHSEMTHGDKEVHFLQIWSLPSTRGLPPKYYHRHFSDEEKRKGLVPVVAKQGEEGVSDSREGTGPTPVHSPLWLYATLLGAGNKVEHALKMKKGYVHVVQTSGYNTETSKGNRVKVNGALELGEGDGAFVKGDAGEVVRIENIGDSEAEVLLFDLD
ncbi:RmlC-like cupin [Serendipita vermifera]|nr:RmlC-like cupin [Serendipita vermifera]